MISDWRNLSAIGGEIALRQGPVARKLALLGELNIEVLPDS